MMKRLELIEGGEAWVRPDTVSGVRNASAISVTVVERHGLPELYVKGTPAEVVTAIFGHAAPDVSGRVELALELADTWGGMDGAHHKAWVIDQMVRALTECPFQDVGGRWACNGESADYRAWVVEHCHGADGPNTYDWDTGTAP